MKKQHFSLVMIFISISLLTSCNSSFLDLDFTSLTDDYQINNLAQKHIEPSNWEEQVEYAMQSNAFKQIGGKNSVPRNSCITFTEGGGNNKVIITDMSDSEHNIYGGLLWRYRIFSISEFNRSNTLIRANNIPESEGKLGWRCSAKMHTIAPIILHNM